MRIAASRKRTFWGWGALVAFVVLLGALGHVDATLKRAPHPGYAPPQTQWMAFSPDWPRCWRELGQLECTGKSGADLADLADAVAREARRVTGLRPLPSRWRLWLGNPALFGLRGNEWGICFHPGLLARLAHFANAALDKAPGGPERLYRLGDLHYAWREGFVIASASPAYVRDAVHAAPSPFVPPLAPNRLKLVYVPARHGDAWQPFRKIEAVVRIEDGLPFDGRAALTRALEAAGQVRVPTGWAEPPLLMLAGPSPRHVTQAVLHVAEWLPSPPRFQWIRRLAVGHFEAWGFPALSETWNRLEGDCALVLHDVDFSGGLPIPELGLLVRRSDAPMDEHPFATLLDAGTPLRYAWREHEGWILPLLGEPVSLCIAADASYWLAASRERTMDALAGQMSPGEDEPADLVAAADWAGAAAAAPRAMELLRDWDVLEPRALRFVEDYGEAARRALARLGAMRIVGHARGNWVEFSGALASQGPWGAPR